MIDNPWAFLIKGTNDSWVTFIESRHNPLGFSHYKMVTLELDSLNLDKTFDLPSLRDVTLELLVEFYK